MNKQTKLKILTTITLLLLTLFSCAVMVWGIDYYLLNLLTPPTEYNFFSLVIFPALFVLFVISLVAFLKSFKSEYNRKIEKLKRKVKIAELEEEYEKLKKKRNGKNLHR